MTTSHRFTAAGVPIYANVADLPPSAAVGTVAATETPPQMYQFDGSAWNVFIGGSSPYVSGVADTNSVDLTLSGGSLSAAVKRSASGASAGTLGVTLNERSDGLQAEISVSSLLALPLVSGVSDTATVDLTLSGSVLSASVIPSGTLATPLTGFNAGGASASGTVISTDTILQAFQKLQGTDFLTDQRIDTLEGSIYFATNDPVSTAYNAPAGSLIFYAAGPQWYLKRDNGSTTNVYAVDLPVAGNPGNWNTGWKSTTGITLSGVGGTSVSAILSQPTQIQLSGRSVELASGTYVVTCTGTAGARFCYFDDASGTPKIKSTFPNLLTEAFYALAIWNGSTIDGIAWEFHGLRDNVWHIYTHFTRGFAYRDGANPTFTTSSDNNTNPGANPAVETFYVSSGGRFYDEDILVTHGTAPWDGVVLGSGQTYSTGASLPFYYYNGSAFLRLAPMADTVPFIYTGTNGTPQRNNAGTLTAAVTGDYVVYWVYASSLIGRDTMFCRPHNNATAYTSLVQAAASTDNSLVWTSFPAAEVKLCYRLIFRVNTTWGSTHRSKLVQFDDYRGSAGSPVAGLSATAHTALSGRDQQNQHPSLAVNFAWVTGTTYEVGNIVTFNDMFFECLTAHTAGTFLTDYAAARWKQCPPTIQNNQTNTSAIPDFYNADSFPSVASGQSASFGLTGATVYLFEITTGSTGDGIVCAANYASNAISCISDPSDVFSSTVVASKLCVTKASGSSTIIVTNNLGTRNIGFLPVRCAFGTVTNWT